MFLRISLQAFCRHFSLGELLPQLPATDSDNESDQALAT